MWCVVVCCVVLCCVVLCCVVLCCVVSVRCMFLIFVGTSKIWRSPDPLRRTPLLRTAQNFPLFFPLPPQISFFLLSWWSFRGICGGVWSVGAFKCAREFSGCRETPESGFCKMSRTILQLICASHQTSEKSMTNECKFCLCVQKKKPEHNRTKFQDAPLPTFGTHTSWPSLICCLLCLLLLLGHRPSTPPLPPLQCFSKMLFTFLYNQLRQNLSV